MLRAMSARDRILERRARFVAAAMVSAAMLPGCEGPDDGRYAEPCLSMPRTCDDVYLNRVLVPSTVCAGERFEVQADAPSDCAPVFATSDPDLLVIDGSTAVARKPGKVTITAIFRRGTVSAEVEILACASDAAAETASDGALEAPASDAAAEAASDATPGDAPDAD